MDKLCPLQIIKQPRKIFAIILAIILHVLIIALIFFRNYNHQSNKMLTIMQVEILNKKLNNTMLLPIEHKLLQQKVSIPQKTPTFFISLVKTKKILTKKPDIILKKNNNIQIKKEKFKLKTQKILKQKAYLMNTSVNKFIFKQQNKQDVQITNNKKQITNNKKLYLENFKLIDIKINNNHQTKLQKQYKSFNTIQYIDQLKNKIYSNTIFYVPTNLDNNVPVEYMVKLFPDGFIQSIHKIKPSSLIGFDDAVERAIEKSQPFPPNENGKIPSHFTFTHKPRS